MFTGGSRVGSFRRWVAMAGLAAGVVPVAAGCVPREAGSDAPATGLGAAPSAATAAAGGGRVVVTVPMAPGVTEAEIRAADSGVRRDVDVCSRRGVDPQTAATATGLPLVDARGRVNGICDLLTADYAEKAGDAVVVTVLRPSREARQVLRTRIVHFGPTLACGAPRDHGAHLVAECSRPDGAGRGGLEVHTIAAVDAELWVVATVRPDVRPTPGTVERAAAGNLRFVDALLAGRADRAEAQAGE